MSKGQPLAPDLWYTFTSAALQPSTRPLYCVIDGINECSEPYQELLDRIRELVTSHTECKVVIVGRPHVM